MTDNHDPYAALREARHAILQDLDQRSIDVTHAIADFLARVDAATAESIGLPEAALSLLATLRPVSSQPVVPVVVAALHPGKTPAPGPNAASSAVSDDNDFSPEEIRSLVLTALAAGDEGAGQIAARIWAGKAVTAARTEKVHTALTQLKTAGKIVRVSRGKYAPAPKDADAQPPAPALAPAPASKDAEPVAPPPASPEPAPLNPAAVAFQVLATGMSIAADKVVRLAAGDTFSGNLSATDSDIAAVNNAPAVAVALGVEYAILVQETDGLFVYRALAIPAA